MPRRSKENMIESPKKGGSIRAPHPEEIPAITTSLPAKNDAGTEKEALKIIGPAPYDDDPIALAERDSIDYSIKVTAEMAQEGNAPRKVRVYADGIYDLFHQGHARQLMQAKNVFPKSDVYLLVGVCSDELTHAEKGITVMTEEERYDAIRHCRYVDEVVQNAPWTLDDAFLEKHKIDFVAHDELPYGAGNTDDIYAHLKAKGMFVATQRTEGVSTTDVVARILRNYESYVRRNLERGYTREQLNVSFLRGQRLMFKNRVDHVKEQTKDFIERKKEEYLHLWEDTSKDMIGAFLKYFGTPINEFWNRGKRRITQVLSPKASPEREIVDHDFDDIAEEIEQSPAKRSRLAETASSSSVSLRTSPRTSKKT